MPITRQLRLMAPTLLLFFCLRRQQQQPQQHPSAAEPELRLAVEPDLEKAATARVQSRTRGGGRGPNPNLDSGNNDRNGIRSDGSI